ncbi:MAG: preprotein translocase subunit YajC [Candidatus Omnitrophica bacterium 4484_171]|nr:MAG: preprotein translocase subunit YajC [Candidatus Omnitrophica bacterium 4484_171]
MQANTPSFAIQIMPFVFLIFIFYFFIIKPQQKKQKEHKQMIEGIKKNDEIVTAGGIHGTVVSVKDKTFILRIDEGAKMEIDKVSVSYIKKKRDDKTA